MCRSYLCYGLWGLLGGEYCIQGEWKTQDLQGEEGVLSGNPHQE